MIAPFLSLFLATAAIPGNAVEAEKEFAQMAQTKGMWTAFRAYAAPDAIMLIPQTVNAQLWLKERKDPAMPIVWWPSRSWAACDGATAVNIGPAVYGGGKAHGMFSTVWQRQQDGGWKWLLDQGHDIPAPLPASDVPPIAKASCSGKPSAAKAPFAEAQAGNNPVKIALQKAGKDLLVLHDGRMPANAPARLPKIGWESISAGESGDKTLVWKIYKAEEGEEGSRAFLVFLWNGKGYDLRLLAFSGISAG